MHVLETKGLRKGYDGKIVVTDLDVRIASGEIIGLLGPNGAGKTTSFYMIVGAIRQDAGRIFLDDEDISSFPMYERARRGIGYLPQEPSIFRKLTVEENILAVLEIRGMDKGQQMEKAEAVIAEFNLEPILKRQGHMLSGGERRRVEIARAFALDPLFILLDEPFAGIDPITVGELKKTVGYLRDRGIGVIITDHNVRDTLSITDRAYIINDGRVFETGTPSELVHNQRVRKVYLGEDFRL